MALPHMRTLAQVYKEIKEEDPQSSISMNYLRMLVKTRPKEIGVFKTGVKNLINKDMLINYLNGEQIQEEKNSTNIDYGKIRRVCE